jgi:2-polyprenyl-6-methoxyphenol hydroxylase-like FAD-dependent oxidoreductase
MAEGAAMALEDGLVLADYLAAGGGIARATAGFQARRTPRTQWVLLQTHRRDHTRNLPPSLRNVVLRRWGRDIFHANYRRLLDPP